MRVVRRDHPLVIEAMRRAVREEGAVKIDGPWLDDLQGLFAFELVAAAIGREFRAFVLLTSPDTIVAVAKEARATDHAFERLEIPMNAESKHFDPKTFDRYPKAWSFITELAGATRASVTHSATMTLAAADKVMSRQVIETLAVPRLRLHFEIAERVMLVLHPGDRVVAYANTNIAAYKRETTLERFLVEAAL